MVYPVEELGMGVYRVGGYYGKMHFWDDYPDDKKHEGYGVLVKGDDRKEIVGILRNEFDKVIAMDLVDFVEG